MMASVRAGGSLTKMTTTVYDVVYANAPCAAGSLVSLQALLTGNATAPNNLLHACNGTGKATLASAPSFLDYFPNKQYMTLQSDPTLESTLLDNTCIRSVNNGSVVASCANATITTFNTAACTDVSSTTPSSTTCRVHHGRAHLLTFASANCSGPLLRAVYNVSIGNAWPTTCQGRDLAVLDDAVLASYFLPGALYAEDMLGRSVVLDQTCAPAPSANDTRVAPSVNGSTWLVADCTANTTALFSDANCSTPVVEVLPPPRACSVRKAAPHRTAWVKTYAEVNCTGALHAAVRKTTLAPSTAFSCVGTIAISRSPPNASEFAANAQYVALPANGLAEAFYLVNDCGGVDTGYTFAACNGSIGTVAHFSEHTCTHATSSFTGTCSVLNFVATLAPTPPPRTTTVRPTTKPPPSTKPAVTTAATSVANNKSAPNGASSGITGFAAIIALLVAVALGAAYFFWKRCRTRSAYFSINQLSEQ
ncbi:hypothetical protein SDRG_11699 [Saprolegnia diclina VS20]|uniref:Uncharacterized protein n=1 Tax=Saprolegnia diclina (strain VS20) TaxID=1156394 RepID=T0PYL7_SAPDV|nr:hypothetical protein SDRG_11699 [Saprolegnia diclina VS20]EQC30644.1 hypothetical protein SDRG_11699 [Saprolegnia diclina VS20]|eukprot:XP_008615970.1 hypothetical protein SDRG_11699 [Saprolegnia diclina VS20]